MKSKIKSSPQLFSRTRLLTIKLGIPFRKSERSPEQEKLLNEHYKKKSNSSKLTLLTAKLGIPYRKSERSPEQQELLNEHYKKIRLANLRAYTQTEAYRKSLAKHRSSEKYKETTKAWRKGNVKYKPYKPLTDPIQIKKRYEHLKKYRASDKGKEADKKYYKKHLNKLKKYQEERRVSGKTSEYERQYRPKYIKEKRSTDIKFRLISNLRSRMKTYLRSKNIKKLSATKKMIGCTPEELIKHIEKQWTTGMSWKTYGLKGWHIDHIKPISLATNASELEIGKFMHYTNLQPLWAKENIRKGNKYNV
jgi:hypothetical protein